MKLEASLGLCLALTLPSLAGAERFSRTEVVALALQANPEVLRSLEDLALLEGRVLEARADALPELSLVATATRYRDPALLNSSSFDAFPPELRNSLRPIPANLFGGAAELRQTVFSFKLGRAIRAARLGRSLGNEEVKRSRQAIALEAIRAYNGFLLSLEKVQVTGKSVLQKEKHLEMARNRRQAGVATDLDVLRSQVDLENQRTQLLRAGGEAGLARGVLNAVMMRPIDGPIEPSDSLGFVPFEIGLEATIAEALANRPEMKSATLNERIYQELIGLAQADSRPRLEFVGSLGYSVREPENFFNSDFSRWNAGVTLTVPLFDGFRTAGRVGQARAELGKVTQDRAAVENQIRLEAKETFDRLQVATSVLQAAELNVSQAEKALTMTQANYNLGAATTLDVLDAQAALTLAESLRLEARHEHANARSTLRYAMGRDPLDLASGENR